MKVDIFSQKNEKTGEMDLPEKIFKAKWNPELVHQALYVQEMMSRDVLAHAKDRSEVRGGGRKPWRQKGTGRARHGSIRSPLWKGGGVTHGPRKEVNFTKKINKKMRRLAIFGVLSRKLKDNEVKILDDLKIEKAKAKSVAAVLKNVLGKKESALFISSTANKNLKKAGANIPKVGMLSPFSLNVRDLLKHKNIILEKDAVKEIENHYLESGSVK